MLFISTRRFVKALLVLLVAAVFASTPYVARAQKAEQKPSQAAPPAAQLEQPHYSEYRGVRLGMPASDVRAALGTPKEIDGRQEFYAISDNEVAQVFYDAQRNVWAVTVSYVNGQNAPTAEKVFGSPVETKPDGSIYKMVKYEHASYYVAYSRDAGDAPFVSIVMQKLP